jgi:hypothetical protein
MTQSLDLTVDSARGAERRTVDVARVYNLGFTIRDKEKQQRHIDEVVGVHVDWPEKPPIIFPISAWATITESDVPVQYETTSGEVEFVIIDDGRELMIGVGSDHTDRKLEAVDIPWGKQVAPNVIAPTVWRWSDVQDHWDQVSLQSYVGDGTDRVLYQKASAAEFWTPLEMLEGVKGRIAEVEGPKIYLSGTVVSEKETLDYGREWTIRMQDPVAGKSIEHTYNISVLQEEISD